MRLPIPEFKILLYGPGLPPAGIRARAHFEESVLVIQGKGHWFTIQGEKLQLKTGGFDGRQWLLTWYTPSGPVTAMLQGDDAVEAFIKLAPAVVADELKRVHWEHGSKKRLARLGMALLAMLLLLSVLGLGLFWMYGDQVSRWAADRVSQEQKDRLGELAFEQMRPSLKLVERGEVRETVEFIGVRVTTGSRKRYVFHVADAPQVDAIALPGGHVVVFTGLLREVRSPDELASVLAHEASHVEKRHVLRNLIHALGWRAVLATARDDFSGGVWERMATELAGMSYSQELEREADSEALVMLRRAGVSAQGLLPFFERMAQPETATPYLWASHPSSQERIAALREQIGSQVHYQSRPLSVDWLRFQRALSRLSVN